MPKQEREGNNVVDDVVHYLQICHDIRIRFTDLMVNAQMRMHALFSMRSNRFAKKCMLNLLLIVLLLALSYM